MYNRSLILFLEFHTCPGNSDFPEVIKNKFAHGTGLNFYDKQKTIKAKIENKIFSTVEELDYMYNKLWSFYT